MALGGHRVSCHQSAELGVSGNRRRPPCPAWLVGGCVGPRWPDCSTWEGGPALECRVFGACVDVGLETCRASVPEPVRTG